MIDKLKEYEAIVASGEIGACTRNEVAALLGRAANEISAKDSEIEKLRALVNELADELETMICNEIVKSSKGA